jgi:hypothetical protein
VPIKTTKAEPGPTARKRFRWLSRWLWWCFPLICLLSAACLISSWTGPWSIWRESHGRRIAESGDDLKVRWEHTLSVFKGSVEFERIQWESPIGSDSADWTPPPADHKWYRPQVEPNVGKWPEWHAFANNCWYIRIPIWHIRAALAFALLACLWPTIKGARRCPPWACRKCRYDLRGIAATAVCPECGTPRPGSTTAA